MKNFSLLLTFPFLLSINSKTTSHVNMSSRFKPKNISLSDGITGTYYHSTIEQCDSTPSITSDGSHITKNKINKLRWCALSRDLLNVPDRAKNDDDGNWIGKYKYGDTIQILSSDTSVSQNNSILGTWVVHDCMNKRYKKRIDFLVSKKYYKGGKWDNITIIKYETNNNRLLY
jgi:hypothetical protein